MRGAGDDDAARRAAQRRRDQPRGRRGRRPGRQPHASAASPRATTSSSTGCATSAATTATPFNLAAGRGAARDRRRPLRARVDGRRRQPGEQDAALQPFARATLVLGTDATYRVHRRHRAADTVAREGAAFRLNLMGNDSQVAGRDVAENRRFGIAPSLALRPRRRDTRVGSPTFTRPPTTSRTTAFPGTSTEPAPVDRANYYGFEDGNFLRHAGRHRNGPHRARRSTRRSRCATRSATRTTRATCRSPRRVCRPGDAARRRSTTSRSRATRSRSDSVESFLAEPARLDLRFETGPCSTRLVTGFEAGRETSDPTRRDLHGRADDEPARSRSTPSRSPERRRSPRASDVDGGHARRVRARHDEHRRAVGRRAGFRWDRFDVDYSQSVAPAVALPRASTTCRAGAPPSSTSRIRPARSTSTPGRRSTRPPRRSSLSAANANLDPEENRTYEVGTKWDFSDGRLSPRLARLPDGKDQRARARPEQSLRRTSSPGSSGWTASRSRRAGRSSTATGSCVVSYAYLDARADRAPKHFRSDRRAPRQRAREHVPPLEHLSRCPGSSSSAAARTTSAAAPRARPRPTIPSPGLLKEAPGYWTSTRWSATRSPTSLDLQVNLYNLGQHDYYDQLHPGHIVPGTGRSALVGVSAHW